MRILDLRNRADMESLLLDIPITSCDADGVLRKAQFMLGMLRSLPNAVRRILVSVHCSDGRQSFIDGFGQHDISRRQTRSLSSQALVLPSQLLARRETDPVA